MVMVAVTLFMFLLWNLVVMFWLSPVRVKRRLVANGFGGPTLEFPRGNLTAMFNKKQKAAVSRNTYGIHSTVFPYIVRWRKSFGECMTLLIIQLL